MTMHAYRAYGLRIHANIDCPALPQDPHPSDEPDVVISLSENGSSPSSPLQGGGYTVQPGQFHLHVPEVARYSVEQGKRIVIEPIAGSSPERIRLFLLGSAMGALLYQRGLFPLHGSAIDTPFGVMIFVGTQGAGKSTLAAEFLHRGYRLLSDDICAIQRAAEGLRVLPALAHIRLCADAYDRLERPRGAHFDVDKFLVPMGNRYCPDPRPLKAIHILSDQEGGVPRFEVLRGFDRLRYLLDNLYRPQFLQGQRTQGDLMGTAGVIAKEATVASVARRKHATASVELVGFLEAAWERHFGQTSCQENHD